METIRSNEFSFIELTVNEVKFINGGVPTRATSIFYDAFYYIANGAGKLYRAAEEEGMFTRSWWADYSIDLSS